MRREDRAIVAPLGFLHGVVHANILAIPVFLLAWRVEFRADDVTLGLLAATAFGSFGLSSVPFGFLADRRAPATLLLGSAIGIAASLAAIAVSPSLTSLAAALAALGLASGIYHPTGLSAISRTVQEQGRGMGWHGMGGSLGIAFGPAFAGATLAMGWSWRTTVALLGVLPVLAAILLALRPPPAPRDLSPDPVLPFRSLATLPYLRMILVYLFAGFAYQGALTFLPSFVGPEAFALALGLGAIGQVIAGTLADLRRPDRILTALSLVAAALLASLALTAAPPAATGGTGSWVGRLWNPFTIAALGFGFVLFSLEALQNTLVIFTVPRAIRGFAFGLTFLSVFGLGSVGAAAAGWLIARGESSSLFLLLAASLSISGGVALGVRKVEGVS